MNILSTLLFALSLSAFFLSICSFLGKGFLFNNTYIHASENEREKMNKKPYYHQSGIVFLLIGLLAGLLGSAIWFQITWMLYVADALAIILCIYAVVSSILIHRRK